MNHIPIKSTGPLNNQSILSINQLRVQGPKTSQNIQTINSGPSAPSTAQASPSPGKSAPSLIHTVQKGQKVPLAPSDGPSAVRACLGWRAANAACDVDVSAFLLNSAGKVPGDNWFVFYGQEKSPDGSVVFSTEAGADRESISVDFAKLSSQVAKIVFVLTIHEALSRHLNFSMLKDAYIRILDASSNQEIVSFQMDEYYANVTSMMIGEIYRHNGSWKFNAIGNGVAKDLAGLCELYGVQVV
ncbi:MAG: TerD family protein [Lachnospiraceae bacterium]|nr:TerD family protein [Lachnospiraceae bacterium]